MKKKIQVEVEFLGNGRVIRKKAGAFVGGVRPRKIGRNVSFTVHREVPDEQGLWNPPDGEDSLKAGLQINIYGNSNGYRELGRYLLALSELDTKEDPDFHDHQEGIVSSDGRTRLHLILRKTKSAQPSAAPDRR